MPAPWSLCVLNQDGEILLHRNMPAGPEPFLKAVAPYRADLVVCVDCLFTWYWLADLCAREGIPFVLGHALYMKAIHGGKAKHDTIDAQKIAVLLRGGHARHRRTCILLPCAPLGICSGGGMHLMRKRAELLAHIQNTNSQYNLRRDWQEDRLQSRTATALPSGFLSPRSRRASRSTWP